MNASYCKDAEGWGPTSDSRMDVTYCFGNTILLAAPSLLAIILFIKRAYTLHTKDTTPKTAIPRNRWHYWVSLTCMLTAFAALVARIVQLAQDSVGTPSSILGTAALLVAWILAMGLNFFENQRSSRSSTYICSFNIACLCASAISIRTMYDIAQTGHPQFVSFCVFFAAIGCNFIAETWPRSIASNNGHESTAYDQSNLFSRLCFHYIQYIVSLGYRRPLQEEDITNVLPHQIHTLPSYHLLSQVWDRHVQKRKLSKKPPSLLWIVIKAGGWSWVPIFLCLFIGSFMEYIQPVFLDILLGFIASYSIDSHQSPALGVILSIGMFTAALASSIASGQYHLRATNMGITLKTGLTSMIYRKSLKLSPRARRETTVGEITNHMSVDVERICHAIDTVPLAITSPLEIAVGTWLLYRQLGPSSLTGLGVVILLIPLQGHIAKILNTAMDKKLGAMDGRIRLLTEVLSGIKIVKLYSWEHSFLQRLKAYREKELEHLTHIGIVISLMMIMFTSLPSLMTLLSFVVYALVGGPGGTRGVMSAQVVFVSITLFGRLSVPIGRASGVINQAIALNVAVGRIQSYLLQEELDDIHLAHQVPEPSLNHTTQLQHQSASTKNICIGTSMVSNLAIQIKNGAFSWDSPSANTDQHSMTRRREDEEISGDSEQRPTTLTNINMEVAHGSLTVVMGRVGQGKSSLLSAMIGDMYRLDGKVQINGRVAYVPQQAWIINATLKDNILFGKELDQERYDRIVMSAGLTQDLKVLPAGDQTEIGERGINLSGGQKQRVSVARAAYQDADVYLLDDPLSAVDAHVDQHLWQNLIGPNGLLKDRTRLLITHGIHHLCEVDQIMVIKDGTIDEAGNYQDLMGAQSSFYQLIREYSASESQKQEAAAQATRTVEAESVADFNHVIQPLESQLSESAALGPDATHEIEKEDDRAEFIVKEATAEGSVGWNVFKSYAKAATYFYSILSILGFVLSQAAQISINLWLQNWVSQEGDGRQASLSKFFGVYAALVATYIFMDIGVNLIVFTAAGIRATRLLHNTLLEKVMRLPMSFFDTTPVGRIVNRFSTDTDNVDQQLPFNISDFYFFLTTVLGTMVVISISVPIFLALIPFLAAIYIVIQIYYIRSSRALKRIHSVSKSPLYNHFGETLAGVSTIRAMRIHDQFVLANALMSDRSANAFFALMITNRWLHFRLECLGAVIVLATSMLAVLARETLGPGMAGLALSYALNTTFAITLLVSSLSELQNQLVSMERIQEYSDKNQEAPVSMPRDAHLPPNWPSEGRVVFKNYSTRYRPGTDLVIKDVSFEVQPAEKVGIVGRTGAGKSSLTLALFRIIEAADSHWARESDNDVDSDADLASFQARGFSQENTTKIRDDKDGGSIEIDGVDIATIGLERLRQHLAIIPQDPTLFAGNVRDNLDPFNELEDAELWEALDRAHLKDSISSLPGGLSYEVAQNGENFSVGQRSLICLARALLRKTKILVLDEATAAVDVETDDLIQKTIRKEFKDRTILTIAHRIKTVMDSDKILVLEKGKVQEYDSPSILLQRQGLFYSLAQQAGEST
ncbi:Multidrug resistance-associated protein 1 [Mortierella polycephala]|uniref:Multidrug resistance-associated protein 1 n=1 Tax=Mortierella polycephala TaxID=41804 RepID=A0A9P6QD91_9FUNG|nr:Multidrug resistance-associated protein 1 [Mortierella polycephala]